MSPGVARMRSATSFWTMTTSRSGRTMTMQRLPGSPASPDVKVLKTDKATITLDDKSGQGVVKIETGNLKIVMDSNGIELSNGSQTIKLSSNNVSINNGALEVT